MRRAVGRSYFQYFVNIMHDYLFMKTKNEKVIKHRLSVNLQWRLNVDFLIIYLFIYVIRKLANAKK